MATALVQARGQRAALRRTSSAPSPGRWAPRYFDGVRFPPGGRGRAARGCSAKGFVVHVHADHGLGATSSTWPGLMVQPRAAARPGRGQPAAAGSPGRGAGRPSAATLDVRFSTPAATAASAWSSSRQTAMLVAPAGQAAARTPSPPWWRMARKSDRPVFLVPELLVWEKRSVAPQARLGGLRLRHAPRRRASSTRCSPSGATTSARSSGWASPST